MIVAIGAHGDIDLRSSVTASVAVYVTGWFSALATKPLLIKQVVPDFEGYCALLTSGGVYCWGYGQSGELGNGNFAASTTPVPVVGTGGTGTLSGVRSLASDGQGVCAVLGSGGVDCWGYGGEGELGDGSFLESAVPVPVKGVGGSGTLTGVASLAPFNEFGGSANYCALLRSGGVDCWGFGLFGQLGDGKFYTTGNERSDVPVAVKGVGGTGTLTGVASMDTSSANGHTTYCAVLTSGGVDCWGYASAGQLGDGVNHGATQGTDVPVAVAGVGGSGTLTGVSSIKAGFTAFCAVLTSGGVDCWGAGGNGQLGNNSNSGSDTPIAVEGVGGTGTLSAVKSLSSASEASFCALLSTGGVDCWGFLYNVEYVPVQVPGVGGSGDLSGVTSLAATSFDGFSTYCARLSSAGANC